MSVSPDDALLLREAVTTYLRLFALADSETQAVCEQLVARIDEQTRLPDTSGVVGLSPADAAMPAEAGTGSFNVALIGEGSWAAIAVEPWLHVDSPTGPETASGTVAYSVQAHNGTVGEPASDRAGTIQVNDAVFAVTQTPWDVLPVEVAPKEASFGAGGGPGAFDVTVTGSGTSGTWTVDVLNAAKPWLTVDSPLTPQSTDGSVTYTVWANTGPEREGKFFVNGQAFTVTQAAGGI